MTTDPISLNGNETIWAVSSGSYSDYGLMCLFTTRDLAIQYAAAINKAPVETMREYTDLGEPPYSLDKHALRQALVRKHPRLNWGAYVESFQVYDEVPA